MSEDMHKLKNIVNELHKIPASEQFIGHLQGAVQDAFRLLIEEMEKLQKLMGVYRS